MNIIRVFPRRTSYTPVDDRAFIGTPGLFRPEADEVHISITFSWDIGLGEYLKEAWKEFYSVVRIGGPAYGFNDDEFTPGRYIKSGVTFTSRGCNYKCPWCLVPKIEGRFRELKVIHPGNIIQDNNVLLSSKKRFEKVVEMLKTQKRIEFTGGIDCRLLTPWHVELLKGLRVYQLFLALDSWDRGRSPEMA